MLIGGPSSNKMLRQKPRNQSQLLFFLEGYPIPTSQKALSWDWGDDSVGKSTCRASVRTRGQIPGHQKARCAVALTPSLCGTEVGGLLGLASQPVQPKDDELQVHETLP